MTCFVILIFAVALILASYNVIAASGPKQVRGYIWDIEGRNITGADITINIRWESDDTIRSTLTDTSSDPLGYYAVTFAPANWDIGDRIEVISTYLSNQESNSTTATSMPYQWVNVTYPFVIPVFGSTLGFLVAGGLLGAVAVVMLTRKQH